MIEKLKKHINNTPIEQVKKEWKELTDGYDSGPTINEFNPKLETKEELEENRIPAYKPVDWDSLKDSKLDNKLTKW